MSERMPIDASNKSRLQHFKNKGKDQDVSIFIITSNELLEVSRNTR